MKSPPNHSRTQPSVRLNKFLSGAGIASRRKADDLITEGRVLVNGTIISNLGAKIDPSHDRVFVDGKQVSTLSQKLVYIVLNKPKDAITTASDERGRTTVMDYVRTRDRIYPIGRLDRNTTGVLLLTNDGEFANRMMHPKHEIEKAYRVTLDRSVQREDIDKLSRGIRLREGMTDRAAVYPVPGTKNRELGIVIHEGRNRQIHRMFEALGYVVVKLDRVAYAGITYDGLPRGRWRHLTRTEVLALTSLAGGEKMAE